MFDLIGGLPVHPLVVHAVVVLLPLAILGTIAVAVRPAWRARYGGINALVAVVGTALCPVATSSGESLERRVGDPGRHADLGDQLVWFALPMAVLAVVLWWLQRRRRDEAERAGNGRAAVSVVAALAVVASIATAVQVYRVGDSGAQAVWKDQVNAAPQKAGS
ncbi:DUF2231 domain-containing protein [Kineococcus sp. NPDC059986]|uniref:DUF2231 domain-containing protein n=1 Tax=Kineococcus sp. NPDC059986 TaxID=3155538 RepID=UPI003450F01F